MMRPTLLLLAVACLYLSETSGQTTVTASAVASQLVNGIVSGLFTLLAIKVVIAFLCMLSVTVHTLILCAQKAQVGSEVNLRMIMSNVWWSSLIVTASHFGRCIYLFIFREQDLAFSASPLACTLQDLVQNMAGASTTLSLAGAVVERILATTSSGKRFYCRSSRKLGIAVICFAWSSGAVWFLSGVALTATKNAPGAIQQFCQLSPASDFKTASQSLLLIAAVAILLMACLVDQRNKRCVHFADECKSGDSEVLRQSYETTHALMPTMIAYAVIKCITMAYAFLLGRYAVTLDVGMKLQLVAVIDLLQVFCILFHSMLLVWKSKKIQAKILEMVRKVPIVRVLASGQKDRKMIPSPIISVGDPQDPKLESPNGSIGDLQDVRISPIPSVGELHDRKVTSSPILFIRDLEDRHR